MTLVAFLLTSVAPSFGSTLLTTGAQSALLLPAPGTMVTPTDAFLPAVLKGMRVYPDQALRFDFIIDTGNEMFAEDALKDEATKLVRYFLASLTTPEKDLWVNLSPYEGDRIIPDNFGQTEMGRDLLAQDYILKQITASVIYPEGETGKKFWKDVYAKAYATYGTTDIPIDTFNKVWITPEEATVYVNGQTAVIKSSHLKVLLESDYLAMANNPTTTRGHDAPQQDKERGFVSPSTLPSDSGLNAKASQGNPAPPNASSDIAKAVMREVVIPILEKEVNEGKNFAKLRQIYHAMVLATWFKRNLKESLIGRVYTDQNKVKGIDLAEEGSSGKIWAQYVEAFKKGVFNYVKEESEEMTGEVIPRKYFSGGFAANDNVPLYVPVPVERLAEPITDHSFVVGLNMADAGNPSAPVASPVALPAPVKNETNEDAAGKVNEDLVIRSVFQMPGLSRARIFYRNLKAGLQRLTGIPLFKVLMGYGSAVTIQAETDTLEAAPAPDVDIEVGMPATEEAVLTGAEERAVIAAMGEAVQAGLYAQVKETFEGRQMQGGFRVVNTGSTGRGTYVGHIGEDALDMDYIVLFDAEEDLEYFTNNFKTTALTATLEDRQVGFSGIGKGLMQNKSGDRKGLYSVLWRGKEVKTEITMAREQKLYVDYLKEQEDEFVRQGGDIDLLRYDVRRLKRMVGVVPDIYKSIGGGIAIEQMILQHGGSLKNLVQQLLEAGINEKGDVVQRGEKEFRVNNPWTGEDLLAAVNANSWAFLVGIAQELRYRIEFDFKDEQRYVSLEVNQGRRQAELWSPKNVKQLSTSDFLRLLDEHGGGSYAVHVMESNSVQQVLQSGFLASRMVIEAKGMVDKNVKLAGWSKTICMVFNGVLENWKSTGPMPGVFLAAAPMLERRRTGPRVNGSEYNISGYSDDPHDATNTLSLNEFGIVFIPKAWQQDDRFKDVMQEASLGNVSRVYFYEEATLTEAVANLLKANNVTPGRAIPLSGYLERHEGGLILQAPWAESSSVVVDVPQTAQALGEVSIRMNGQHNAVQKLEYARKAYAIDAQDPVANLAMAQVVEPGENVPFLVKALGSGHLSEEYRTLALVRLLSAYEQMNDFRNVMQVSAELKKMFGINGNVANLYQQNIDSFQGLDSFLTRLAKVNSLEEFLDGYDKGSFENNIKAPGMQTFAKEKVLERVNELMAKEFVDINKSISDTLMQAVEASDEREVLTERLRALKGRVNARLTRVNDLIQSMDIHVYFRHRYEPIGKGLIRWSDERINEVMNQSYSLLSSARRLKEAISFKAATAKERRSNYYDMMGMLGDITQSLDAWRQKDIDLPAFGRLLAGLTDQVTAKIRSMKQQDTMLERMISSGVPEIYPEQVLLYSGTLILQGGFQANELRLLLSEERARLLAERYSKGGSLRGLKRDGRFVEISFADQRALLAELNALKKEDKNSPLRQGIVTATSFAIDQFIEKKFGRSSQGERFYDGQADILSPQLMKEAGPDQVVLGLAGVSVGVARWQDTDTVSARGKGSVRESLDMIDEKLKMILAVVLDRILSDEAGKNDQMADSSVNGTSQKVARTGTTDVAKNEGDKGGIDLNSKELNLSETGDKVDFSQAADAGMLSENVMGIVPVIFSITPLTDPQTFFAGANGIAR
jgi:hypothetical protein